MWALSHGVCMYIYIIHHIFNKMVTTDTGKCSMFIIVMALFKPQLTNKVMFNIPLLAYWSRGNLSNYSVINHN